MKNMGTNLFWHSHIVNREKREKLNGHKSVCLWFTGLSGSGKSTIANEVEKILFENEIRTYVLDGDNIRHGLNNNLGFSNEDRKENIRRIGEVASLMVDAGIVVLAAFVSPYSEDRDRVKTIVGSDNYFEVYVNTSVEVCEVRDVKGLYKKARAGEISNMTGISSPYEAPETPDLEILTEELSVEDSAKSVLNAVLPLIKTYE